MNAKNLKEQYIRESAKKMREIHGGSIRIKVTQAAHIANYPAGAWFDLLIGQVLEPAGVDNSSIPARYVMPNGDAIPISCADVIEVLYNGKCPMCSGELRMFEGHLLCVHADYECVRVDFERIWDQFDALDTGQRAAITGQLLTSLQELNLRIDL